jgi:plastocyanin
VTVYRKLLVVVAMVMACAACSSGGDATTTTGATSSTAAAAGPVEVSIADFAYAPALATVGVGGTVTWTNDDSGLPHTATSADGGWNSETLQPGESFSFTFETAGTFDYTCNIHPSMSGTVTVEG